MIHSFNVKVAEKLGVNKAILLNHLDFWVRKNKANNHNSHEGYFYSYNTYEAWAEIFPYIGIATIKRCLQDLEKDGLIKTAQLSENKWDKTKYYTLDNDYHQWVIQLSVDERNLLPSMDTEVDPSTGEICPVHITDIKPVSNKPLIVKGWYQDMKEKHPKVLAKLSQSVDGKTVSLSEIESIVAATNSYNSNRALGMWFVLPDRKNQPTPKSNRNPDVKACKEIVRRIRDGWTLDKMDEIICKMFGTEYHQQKNFMYLSLEFCHRQDKLEMYENAVEAA